MWPQLRLYGSDDSFEYNSAGKEAFEYIPASVITQI